jgi:hypothetical protein
MNLRHDRWHDSVTICAEKQINFLKMSKAQIDLHQTSKSHLPWMPWQLI